LSCWSEVASSFRITTLESILSLPRMIEALVV